jgi:general secretion pathway protein G
MGKYGLKSVSVCLSVLLTHLDTAPACRQRSAGPCHGFTLVELIFGILIVLTLAAIAVPLFADYIHEANVARAITEIRMLEKEIIIFETERGYYPGARGILTSLQQIGRDNFADPWGTPYQYRVLENESKAKCRRDRSYTPLNEDFDLYSVGPDRQVPTHNQITKNVGADDIVRAREGRYVGEGSKL